MHCPSGTRPCIKDKREYTTVYSVHRYFAELVASQRDEVLPLLADRQVVSEKRTEQRIPLMARVDILWMDNELSPRVAPATLEDRSRRGLRLRMKTSISLGSHITIKSGTLQYLGIVTNCRRDKGGFMVGIQLDPREGLESK